MLLDPQTHGQTKGRVQAEVPAARQDGAALVWNPATHTVQIYVASEDRFYDLSGNVIAETNTVTAIPPPAH